jgi:hypothetical protein
MAVESNIYKVDVGGSGIDRESLSSSRKTGWFSVSPLDKKTLVRRMNARYSGPDPITVKVYADGDTSNAISTVTLRANSGATGVLVNDATPMNASVTTLTTDSTSLLKDGDLIKIDSEIMRIITAGTTSHTVQRGMKGTTAATHANDSAISYANDPLESIRVGKRARYLMVGLESSSSANEGIEINKLEVEVDGN